MNRNREGQYYSHGKWQKFKKEFDLGVLRDQPAEVIENAYINLIDTVINAKAEFNGFEKYKFNDEGERVFWQEGKKDGQWIASEISIDKNGFQAKYYSDKDSLKTFQNISKVISKRISKDSYLMQSFLGIGPSFILTSFQENGNVVKKEYLIDSINLKNPVKTIVTTYKNNLIYKIETTTKQGVKEVENYFYSKENFLDSTQKIKQNTVIEREHFINNKYGDPINYYLIMEPGKDTFKNYKMDYVYDNHKNWIKRMENKVNGAYLTPSKINRNFSLIIREIKY